jgi:NAD(P)-dependent dehydrogenase (short-subunit alcohol dehydrogenase family)
MEDSDDRVAPTWFQRLASGGRQRVVITGGAGRLGTRLAECLLRAGHAVTILDKQPSSIRGARLIHADVQQPSQVSALQLAGVSAVVHLAATHGVHLVSGLNRGAFWRINVRGTQAVLAAARKAGVARFIFASSTSVYGSGTRSGEARLLDETTPPRPEDAYDISKVAAECLVAQAGNTGMSTVSLRFGRFSFASSEDYQVRKLSTGLDVHDGCQAIALALLADKLSRKAYCVASDLELSLEHRRRLGIDVASVLRETYPWIMDAAAQAGVRIPTRVGKSVNTTAIRRDLGYRPERGLEWTVRLWERDPRARTVISTSTLSAGDLWPITV